MKFFEQIQHDIEKYELEQKDIAPKIGVSEAMLTYYLQEKYQIKFIQLYELLLEVYKGKNKDFIVNKLIEFIGITTRKENYKECLEWSLQNRVMNLFNFTLSIEKEKSGEEVARLYELAMQRINGSIQPEELLFKLAEHTCKAKEAIAYATILQLYCFYDTYNYGSILLFMNIAKEQVRKMKTGYLQDSYLLIISQLNIMSLMKNGFIQKAIDLVNENLLEVKKKKFPHVYNFSYCLLAELYIFSDINKALEYIEKGISVDKEYYYSSRLDGLLATRDFIKIYSGDYNDLTLNDPAEKAHFYAKVGNQEKALELLDKLKEQNENLTPFQLYYKALVTKSSEDIETAKEAFYRSGDFYYNRMLNTIK